MLVRFDTRPGTSLDGPAREIVAWRPDVILTQGTQATAAAQRATKTIPIVTSVADPVASGFAASLAKPGGNVTGLSQGIEEIAIKTIEVMRLLVPRVAGVAILHFDGPVSRQIAGHSAKAARDAGLVPVMVPVRDAGGMVRALRGLRATKVQAAYWSVGPGDPVDIANEAIRNRMPLLTHEESRVEAGVLASLHSTSLDDGILSAQVIARIFGGADPADIPFQYPARFRLVINRRTASALGIALSPELLLRAERIIE